LTLPARDEGARVPLAVIVHGSGPMSRDGVMRGQIGLGFGFELPVYQRLAAALAARGFAVYRYDKRTCGAFNDCADEGPSSITYSMLAESFSTSEYVHDAEAALDTVVRHPAIDPARTFFIGHSEGGQLVPVLLTERPAVRAGVLLAPPFHTMSLVLEQQSERVRWAFTLAGQPERGESDARQLHDAAHALGQIERGTHLGDPILGQPPSMWASWIALAGTAPALARELQRPLLVLGGSYDYNVVPSEIEGWARWLDASPRAPHRVRVLPCVTHALNCITQPDPRLITAKDIGRDLAPELIEEIARFLGAQVSGDAGCLVSESRGTPR
jgi:alpha-beta hydrolase superfamily lysophospholipase